jgi:hypothetical protein
MTMGTRTPFKSIHGRDLGIGPDGELKGDGGNIKITSSAVQATITVGAEGASVADQRAITVQLKDLDGNVLDHRQTIDAYVFADSGGAAIATTGGSTGIAIGADGVILATVIAKKYFVLRSDLTGKVTLTWTDTGTEAAFLGIKLPNGRMVISDALTNA